MGILNIFRKRRVKAKMYLMDDGEMVQVDIIKPVAPPKPKKKREHHKLTRDEMWKIIGKKHTLLQMFNINPQNMGDEYIHRDKLWNFFVELDLHNSKNLTEKQQEKIKREIVDRL